MASYSTFSNTSTSLGTGVKVFIVRNDLDWTAGDRARVAYSSQVFMEGYVVSYVRTSLTINIDTAIGDGAFGPWKIDLVTESPIHPTPYPTYPGEIVEIVSVSGYSGARGYSGYSGAAGLSIEGAVEGIAGTVADCKAKINIDGIDYWLILATTT